MFLLTSLAFRFSSTLHPIGWRETENAKESENKGDLDQKDLQRAGDSVFPVHVSTDRELQYRCFANPNDLGGTQNRPTGDWPGEMGIRMRESTFSTPSTGSRIEQQPEV